MNVRVLTCCGILTMAAASVCRSDQVLVEENNVKIQYAYPGADPAKFDRYVWTVPQTGKYKAELIYEAENPGAAKPVPSLAVNVFKVDERAKRLVEKARWLTKSLDSNQHLIQEFNGVAGEKIAVCYYTTSGGMPSINVIATLRILSVGDGKAEAARDTELIRQNNNPSRVGDLKQHIEETATKFGITLVTAPQSVVAEVRNDLLSQEQPTFIYYSAVPMKGKTPDGDSISRVILVYSSYTEYSDGGGKKKEYQVVGDVSDLDGGSLSRRMNKIIFGRGATLDAAITASVPEVNKMLRASADFLARAKK